ncbi:hypothetical protein ACFV5G_24305 [Streptomyces sp. NPDC059766]|uniref:hypothetical protein n=1 Tax=Streptomyces sp. NPDC059766 TaxID=3346940 RepID=UPI00364A5F15
MDTPNTPTAPDGAALLRHARFGSLPEPIRLEDTTAERPASPADPAKDVYNPESVWSQYSCLALDLGL